MHHLLRLLRVFFALIIIPGSLLAAKYNAFGLKFFTTETEHFRINYHAGLEHLVPRVGAQCEKLYEIYRNQYGLTLHDKTEVVLLDSDVSNGWALANTNTITIWTHDFDFNMRGSHDWFEDVITHEYAHIVSIQAGLKLPPAVPEVRVGYFSHPNEKKRLETFHSFAGDILPPWFTEGIAQYSSSAHGADRWDTHRDMILRSLSLSGELMSWENMQVFSGRGDNFEKTYNQGFSMVLYIVEKYGEDKIAALLREGNKVMRLNFDRAIKAVFGVSGHQFYEEWERYIYERYSRQIAGIGEQVYGRKLNKDGYDNFHPRFSGDGKSVYFLSNGKKDYGFKMLYKASLVDATDEKERIKPVAPIGSYYDLHPQSGKICYISSDRKKSLLPARLGGEITSDLYIDTIPPDKKSIRLMFKKTDRQLTEKQSIFSAAFSPDGSRLACAKRNNDIFYLAITDTSGSDLSFVYPPKDSAHLAIGFIYSLDWSPDGKKIVFSYLDRNDRKIGIFDTSSGRCDVICDTRDDERDPAFSPDGRYLYFSSDRTGIFNIYRFEFASNRLERVTNVTGGAFAPALSPDGKQIVYAGYDADGYGIYMLDSIRCIDSSVVPDAIVARSAPPAAVHKIALKAPRPYNFFPRQFLLVPTLLNEQTTSRSENVNKGVSTFKTGLIVNLIDPLTLSDFGNELGGYFFIDPSKLFSFINFDHEGIDIGANYDLALYGVSRMLPFTVSADYMLRGIAGVDWFFYETEGEMAKLPYRVDLQNFNLQLSHFIKGDYTFGGMPKKQLAVHIIGGFNRYDANLLYDAYDLPVLQYNVYKGMRVGTMGTYSKSVVEPTRYVAPRGMVAKIQYDLWNQHSIKDENYFDDEMKERYDDYVFHQFMGHAKMGIGVPWAKRHGIHTDIKGSLLQVLEQDTTFPSFFLPAAWLPGYSYYYRDTRIVQTAANPQSEQSFDTCLVTGKAIISGELSYRFPLSPKFMDKRLGFIYFERIYGAININGGAGWDTPSDFFDFSRDDWLLAYGLELRVEALSFSTYPFDIKLRWDYGADRPAPQGGHRFALSIGYDFDNWGTVLMPDYRSGLLTRM